MLINFPRKYTIKCFVEELLDRNKLNDFQAYVYENKPSVVLLTETWLAKEHLDNEIFPNDTYRCFRLDRTAKTHPPDPLNKNKFKEKGGGVLIAVRSDITVEPKQVAIKSKAEIISVELSFSNKETVCITACYRVGTLGDINFLEIEKHLRASTPNILLLVTLTSAKRLGQMVNLQIM